MNLQDAFLNQLRISKTPVVIYLMGGQQLKGTIKGFDNFVILLELSGKDNLVYKHAVSSVIAQNQLSFFNLGNKASKKEEPSE